MPTTFQLQGETGTSQETQVRYPVQTAQRFMANAGGTVKGGGHGSENS